MGVNVSKQPITEEQKKRHKMAEKMLAMERMNNEKIFKLLLLGAGDSGKSTIVKQMRILHSTGFSNEELHQQRTLIIGNMVHNMANMIRAMAELGIKFGMEDRQADALQILNVAKGWIDKQVLHESDWNCLRELWNDVGVQTCYTRSHEYQLDTSAKYFFDAINRISAPGYIPNQQDMLRSRVSTVGIVEIEFTLRGLTLRVIDVGGQRSQRKKWIHCFENINALIYVAAISEFNQALQEDASVNRLIESIKLFSMIINSRWFAQSSVVLFLNKKDLLEEKLKTCHLSDVFPKYTGNNDYESACKFMESQFLKERADPEKAIYIHRTCATDTQNIEFVLESSFDILLKARLARSGLI